MNKVWFILINSKREGPFTPVQLLKDPRVNPDSLVWKEGFIEWIAIRFVPELADIFKDKHIVKPSKADEEPTTANFTDQITLALQQDPYQWILWILVLILLLTYVLYQ